MSEEPPADREDDDRARTPPEPIGGARLADADGDDYPSDPAVGSTGALETAALREEVEELTRLLNRSEAERKSQESDLDQAIGAYVSHALEHLCKAIADRDRSRDEEIDALRDHLRSIEERVSAVEEQLEAAAERVEDERRPDPVEPPQTRQAHTEPEGDPAEITLSTASFEQLTGVGLSVTQAARVIAFRNVGSGTITAEDLDRIPGLPADLRERLAELA